mmetsp:Transcript_69/g.157  ORF Transcript_69/g.157 Transcript_69/m.157 type:complete len:359 (+) Transcript_69:149-1225(+)
MDAAMMKARAVELLKTSPGTAAIAVLSVVFTFITLVFDEHAFSMNYRMLTTKFYLHTLITAHLAEVSFIKLFILVPIMMKACVKLELSWGTRGFLVFLSLVSIYTAAIHGVEIVFMYMLGFHRYFESILCGHFGLFIAVLVGCLRIDQEDTFIKPSWKVRKFIFPVLSLYGVIWIITMVLSMELGVRELDFIHDAGFGLIAFFTSYYLLRRYDFSRADPGSLYSSRVLYDDDPFSFDMFFPDILRPVIRAVCLSKYCSWFIQGRRMGSASGVSTLPTYTSMDNSAPLPRGVSLTAGKKTDPVSERRRARALKALDMKLAQMSREPEIKLDGNDEDDEDDETVVEIGEKDGDPSDISTD